MAGDKESKQSRKALSAGIIRIVIRKGLKHVCLCSKSLWQLIVAKMRLKAARPVRKKLKESSEESKGCSGGRGQEGGEVQGKGWELMDTGVEGRGNSLGELLVSGLDDWVGELWSTEPGFHGGAESWICWN